MTSTIPSTSSQPTAQRQSNGTLHILQVVGGVAFIVATLFVAWTPTGLLPASVIESTPFLAAQSTDMPLSSTITAEPELRIGIVSGHWSKDPNLYDPGAVCPDALGGVKEVDVNYAIASRVAQLLTNQGFRVDLLQEFDPQLTAYQSLALVSIHADSCEYINDEATGFKVAAALSNPHPERSNRLVACMQDRYGKETGMTLHPGSVTRDMTEYHAFSEIHNETPAVIIETGFLNRDFNILTTEQDKLAQAISDGILCFVRNEPISEPAATSTATP